MGWWEDMWGRDQGSEQTTSREFTQMPEFEEAAGARAGVWDKLKGGPDYDEISSNWGDIQDLAQKKISQHYWGSALTPGLSGKLKARTAAGNMSGQPAELRTIAKMGAEEGDALSEMAIKMATGEQQEKQQFTKDWYSNMFNMMDQKPDMRQSSSTTTQKDLGGGEGWDMLGSLGSMAMSGMSGGGGGTDWFQSMYDSMDSFGGQDASGQNDTTQAWIDNALKDLGIAGVA